MPKRPPTPPLADDSLFFTVVNPFPGAPYQSLEDSKAFARWIACIVGEENLLSFYHKPKSPNVVIIEVCKGTIVGGLLGAHRWREFLKKPNEDEMHNVSSVFRCRMTTTRSIEKLLWLRRDIESSWFRKWTPATENTITLPYPMSHFCRPPAEDVTGTRLCLSLPAELFHDRATSNTSTRSSKSVSSTPTLIECHRSNDKTTLSSESSDFSADEFSAPPGLPAPAHAPHFVAAFHGADAPRGGFVTVATVATASDPGQKLLWAGYGEQDRRQDELCTAHGPLCSSGICKECALRKREEKFDERTKQRTAGRDGRGRGARPGLSNKYNENGKPGLPPLPTRLANSSRGLETADSSKDRGKGKEEDRTARSRLRPDIKPISAKSKAGYVQSQDKAARRGYSSTAAASGRGGPNRALPLPLHLRQGSKSQSQSQSSATSGSEAESEDVYPGIPSSPSSSSSFAPGVSVSRASSTSSRASSVSSASSSSAPISSASALKTPAWHAYAKIPRARAQDDDERSVASGATSDAFRNPWTRVRPMQPNPQSAWARPLPGTGRSTSAVKVTPRATVATDERARPKFNWADDVDNDDGYGDVEFPNFQYTYVRPGDVDDCDDAVSVVSEYSTEPF